MSLFPQKEAEHLAESEQLARSELEPGENLLYSDKEWALGFVGIGCLGIVLILPGLFFACVAIDTLSESVGFFIFFLILAVLFTAPAYYMIFQNPKNHCFITDKRLCIREINFFGKWKNRDIPLNMIDKAYVTSNRGKPARKRTVYRLRVKTKNGEEVSIKIGRIHPLHEALNEALKQVTKKED